jgi:hypothetical protein
LAQSAARTVTAQTLDIYFIDVEGGQSDTANRRSPQTRRQPGMTTPSERYTTLITSQQRCGTKYTVSPLYS